MTRQFALSCDSISLGLQARSEGSGDKWLTHKVKISTSSVAIGPLHSSLQEWITQQSKCETTDQGNGKALPDLDDDTYTTIEIYEGCRGMGAEARPKPETHQWGSGSPSRKKIGFRGCPEAKVIAKFLLLS